MIKKFVIPDLIRNLYKLDSRFRSPRWSFGEAGGNDKGAECVEL